MIIEDNPFMAELLAEKIAFQGFAAFSTFDGGEGLEKLEKEKPASILLDLPLSGPIDGFEVLKKIQGEV